MALMDVWDEREELFGVGDESDEEMEIIQGSPSHPHHPPPPPRDRELLDESAGKGTGARGKAASNSRHVRFEEEDEEDEELGR